MFGFVYDCITIIDCRDVAGDFWFCNFEQKKLIIRQNV